MCLGIINLFLCTSVDIYLSNLKLLSLIFPIFQHTRQRNIETDQNEQYEDICYSKSNLEHIIMFCMHKKNVYDYCYDYHIHFKIKIHISVMCHYDINR